MFLNKVITKLLCLSSSQQTDGSASITDSPTSVVHHNPDESVEVMTSKPTSSGDDKVQIMHENERHLAALDWRRLAGVINRLFLIIYVIVAIILCLGLKGYM